MLGIAIWSALRLEPLEYEPWPVVPALRALPSGAVSGGSPALIGLEPSLAAAAPPEDLCQALFDDPAAAVPIAFFTDQYCPNCRSIAAKLDTMPQVEVTRHELPILGEASVTAARAILAARAQGKDDDLQRRMHRSAFSPTDSYLREIAGSIGMDVDTFMNDISGEHVTSQLSDEIGLAASLGFRAVPVTVIGRVVILGDIPQSTLQRIVAEQLQDGAPCPF